MINSVRNTVLAILNKNNYGYISPNDFNLYAKQAQLDLFEDLFYEYNYRYYIQCFFSLLTYFNYNLIMNTYIFITYSAILFHTICAY